MTRVFPGQDANLSQAPNEGNLETLINLNHTFWTVGGNQQIKVGKLYAELGSEYNPQS